jgi:hypothetical protein
VLGGSLRLTFVIELMQSRWSCSQICAARSCVSEGESKLVSQTRVLLGKCSYAIVCDSQPGV